MTDYKIILYGDYGVGKTSLTTRLVAREFETHSSSTIGASFRTWKPDVKTNETREKKLCLGIWDTAGQERFSSLLPMYLRGADAVFYCWDYNIPFDIDVADSMYDKAIQYSPDCHFYLVMTKIDQSTKYISSVAAESWATNKEIKGVYYTSSLSGDGVQNLFMVTTENLLKIKKPESSIKVFQIENSTGLRKGCCRI